MVRNVKIAGILLIIVLVLIAAAFFIGRFGRSEDAEPAFSTSQQVITQYQGTNLTFVIETDKTSYEYDDIIYVTARLVNNTDETVTLYLPEGSGYHQEITTEFTCSDYPSGFLMDIDYYYYDLYAVMKPDKEPGVLVLQPGETFAQNMRFSTKFFHNPSHHYPVNLMSGMPSGAYTGTFQVTVATQDQEKAVFSAEIGIIVRERDS